MKTLILPALLVAAIATGSAQTPGNHATEQSGAVVFHDNCARCHGANLEGSKQGPALGEIHTKKRWTEQRITRQILNGEGKMPPFRNTLSADQIQQLVAFLRGENRPAVSSAQL